MAKNKEMDKNKIAKFDYYTINPLLSYNAFINIIIGSRNIGKTFATKKYLLQHYLKYGEQFIYLRRRDTELQMLDKEKFFRTDLLEQVFDGFEAIDSKISGGAYTLSFIYNDDTDKVHKFDINSRRILLDKKILCYFKSLSTGIKLKGSEYDEVKNVMFDEFMIDTNDKYLRYLPNEIEIFFNFLVSVFRRRTDGKVFLLGNATNLNNPYFNYFKFYPTEDEVENQAFFYLKKYGVVVNFPDNKGYIESAEDDNFSNPLVKAMQDTKTFDSTVNNTFYKREDKNIISNLKGYKQKIEQIMLKDKSVLSIYSQGDILYLDKSFDKNDFTLTLNIENLEEECTYLDRSSIFAKNLRKAYYNNLIYYDSVDTKFKFLDSLQDIL